MLDTNEVRIEICTLCNHKCTFCPHEKYLTRKKEIMPYKKFTLLIDKIKDEAPQITELTLSGMGEIFLDPMILRKIEYAKRMGFNVHVLTNGTAITKPHIDYIINRVTDITISLHSINAENWAKITGNKPENHKRVLDNIDYILQYKSHPRLHITCDIIDINKDEIQEIINSYSDRVYNLEIWKPHNWVDTFDYRDITFSHKYSCGRPERSPIQIQVDGTINMCCFDYNGRLVLGDFKNDTLERIFSDKPFIELRNHHYNGFLMEYICDKCDQRMKQDDILIYSKLYKPEERIGKTSTTISAVRKKTKVYINSKRDCGKTILKKLLNKHLSLSEISSYGYFDIDYILKNNYSYIVYLIRDPRVSWFVTHHKHVNNLDVEKFSIQEYTDLNVDLFNYMKDILTNHDCSNLYVLKFENLLANKIGECRKLYDKVGIKYDVNDRFDYAELLPINKYFTKFDRHKIEKYLGRVTQSEFDYISERAKDLIEFFGYEKQLTIYKMMEGALC